MTDKTHQLIGVTGALAAFVVINPQVPLTWPLVASLVVGAVVGSVAPDIDQPTASIWDEFPLGRWIGKLTSRALGGHRNLSHSLLGFALFILLITWIRNLIPPNDFFSAQIFWESAGIGFALHLVADAVTVQGIPVFWPFGNNMGFPPHPLHGARIITGKWFENLVVFPAMALLLLALCIQNSERFCPFLPGLC